MWEVEIVRLVRHLINDWEEPYDYEDGRLQELILVAAQYVTVDLTFKQSYDVDLDNLILSPDPTDRSGSDTRDNSFINLVSLKTACLVDGSEARSAAGRAFSFKQGTSSASLGGTGGVADSKLKVWSQGWCKAYEDAKAEYQATDISSPGVIIVSPKYDCCGFSRSYPIDGRYR